MSAKDIIIKYLRENNYDGLWSDWQECGCEISDLVPCESDFSDCLPGVKHPCKGDDCEWGCEGEDAWHMGPRETKKEGDEDA